MLKKIISISIVILISFSFVCCDNGKELREYKETAKQTLVTYAKDKGKENYTGENWVIIESAVSEGETAVKEAKDKAEVDKIVLETKQKIDKIITIEEAAIKGAVMYNDAEKWSNREFYLKNITRGVNYEIDGEKYYADDKYPLERVIIIKYQEELDNIFAQFPPGVDLESEMILLYIFSNAEKTDEKEIKEIILENKVMTVNFEDKDKTFGPPDASAPYTRWLAVKMKKLDIESVIFSEIEVLGSCPFDPLCQFYPLCGHHF